MPVENVERKTLSRASPVSVALLTVRSRVDQVPVDSAGGTEDKPKSPEGCSFRTQSLPVSAWKSPPSGLALLAGRTGRCHRAACAVRCLSQPLSAREREPGSLAAVFPADPRQVPSDSGAPATPEAGRLDDSLPGGRGPAIQRCLPCRLHRRRLGWPANGFTSGNTRRAQGRRGTGPRAFLSGGLLSLSKALGELTSDVLIHLRLWAP